MPKFNVTLYVEQIFPGFLTEDEAFGRAMSITLNADPSAMVETDEYWGPSQYNGDNTEVSLWVDTVVEAETEAEAQDIAVDIYKSFHEVVDVEHSSPYEDTPSDKTAVELTQTGPDTWSVVDTKDSGTEAAK